MRALDELTVRWAASKIARRLQVASQHTIARPAQRRREQKQRLRRREDHPWDVDIPEAEMMTQEEADAVMNEEDKGVRSRV